LLRLLSCLDYFLGAMKTCRLGASRHPLSLTALGVWLVGLVLAGCVDSVGPEPEGPGGLRIIAGADLTDTVLAIPTQGLVVEVRDQRGTPMSGVVVRFTSLTRDTAGFAMSTVYVGSADSPFFGSFASETTNDRGRATVRIQLGTIAGPGGVVVAVPELGVEDTARYTILPGAIAAVRAAPEDTAVYTGASYQLRAAAVDRFGNPRGDAVTFIVGSGPATVDSGGLVTAGEIGRASVLARSGEVAATAWVSVVPRGTIAALRSSPSFGDSTGLVMVNLDGSGYRWLARVEANILYEPAPRWAPSGAEVIYATAAFPTNPTRLYAVSLSGAVRRAISPQPAELFQEAWPHYSRDGSWIYFSGQTAGTNFALWRAAADGSGAVRIGSDVGSFGLEWRPTPSPDGTRVAFVTFGASGAEIRVLDLATGTNSSWSVPGQTPRWSPTAESIAFVQQFGGPLNVMSADGSGVRRVSAPGGAYAEGSFDWSPDGAWIVARGPNVLELINVQTGLTLPLAFTAALSGPAWKP
jgi:hypothetical protein